MTTHAPDAVLRAEDISVSLGGTEVLRGVDLVVMPGEVHGLIGPNGAGKSTMLRALAMLRPPSGGRVIAVDGGAEHALAELGTRRRARVVSLLPQDTAVDQDFSVLDVVAMGRYAHLSRWSQPHASDDAIVWGAMERAGVAHLADRSARTLSGGQRQLALIAKQLAQHPAVYLLDEPVSALDLGHQLEVIALMRGLAADGAAVVAVLHDIPLASRVCDRITVLHDGLVHSSGTPDEVLTPDMLADVYGVRATVEPDAAIGARAVRVTPLSTV